MNANIASDFDLKITVRNARLLHEIEVTHKNPMAFARKFNISYSQLNTLITMRSSPILMSGEWRPLVLKIAAALNVSPADLWPDHVRDIQIRKSARMVLSIEEVGQIIHQQTDVGQKLIADAVSGVMSSRETEIVAAYHDGEIFASIGSRLGISGARTNQIYKKAIKKMRARAKRMGCIRYEDTLA